MTTINNINTLHQRLKERLKEELPGLPAQQKMQPSFRYPPFKKLPDKSKVRQAGVVLMLYPDTEKEGQIYTALMKRVEDGYAHSGQISLPGGGKEEDDSDIIATAYRETHEEFGVPSTDFELIGKLSDMYIPVSNALVTPVIASLQHKPVFVPETKEVAQIIEVPIRLLRDKNIVKTKKIKRYSGLHLEAPYYDIYEHVVWGATAMILSEFVCILEEIGF